MDNDDFGDDDFDEIERRIEDLRNQYPNWPESVLLHGQLTKYQHNQAYRERYRKARKALMRLGFKTGRTASFY